MKAVEQFLVWTFPINSRDRLSRVLLPKGF